MVTYGLCLFEVEFADHSQAPLPSQAVFPIAVLKADYSDRWSNTKIEKEVCIDGEFAPIKMPNSCELECNIDLSPATPQTEHQKKPRALNIGEFSSKLTRADSLVLFRGKHAGTCLASLARHSSNHASGASERHIDLPIKTLPTLTQTPAQSLQPQDHRIHPPPPIHHARHPPQTLQPHRPRPTDPRLRPHPQQNNKSLPPTSHHPQNPETPNPTRTRAHRHRPPSKSHRRHLDPRTRRRRRTRRRTRCIPTASRAAKDRDRTRDPRARCSERGEGNRGERE